MGDLLAEMMRVKEEVERGPRLPLAVKLHPADVLAMRRDYEPSQAEMLFAPELFVSREIERGQFEVAYTREEVDRWRKEAP